MVGLLRRVLSLTFLAAAGLGLVACFRALGVRQTLRVQSSAYASIAKLRFSRAAGNANLAPSSANASVGPGSRIRRPSRFPAHRKKYELAFPLEWGVSRVFLPHESHTPL